MNEEIQRQPAPNRFEVETLRDFVVEETPHDNTAGEAQKAPGQWNLPPPRARTKERARFKGWL